MGRYFSRRRSYSPRARAPFSPNVSLIKMQRRVIILLSITLASLSIIAWLVAPRSNNTALLTVSFAGREPGLAYRAAGFYVTNCGPQALFLYQVQVQTNANGLWTTISANQPEFSPVLESGAARVKFSPYLEPGERQKIVVEWPEHRPWRVRILYSPEQQGLAALIERIRLLWRTRNSSLWVGRVWSNPGQPMAISTEVTQ